MVYLPDRYAMVNNYFKPIIKVFLSTNFNMRYINPKWLRRFSSIVLLLLGILSMQAQYSVTELPEETVSLRPYAKLLVSGEKSYSLDRIIELSEKGSLAPMDEIEENFGFTDAHFWTYIRLDNPSDETIHFYLETARPITDEVTLHLKSGTDNLRTQYSGDAIPFTEKAVQHRKSAFRMNLKPKEVIDIYIHVKSDGEVVMLPLNLVPERIFLHETYKEQLFYGFFYGILILACIIYLFFYTAMRDTAFIYYGLYVFFIAMLQFSLDGLFHQYVMPDGGYFSKRAVLFAALVSLFFFVNYGRKFLDIRAHSMSLCYCFHVMSAMLILAVVGLKTIPTFLVLCYPLANMIGLVVLSLMITTMIYLRTKKVAVDRFFVIGISFLVLGFVVFILNNLNIIPNSFITENGAKFGIGLEIIFLSLSMGNRIRNLRESNEQNQLLALQRLEDMNDMKSSFISNISHELRTPLNMIMGVADTLRKDQRDKDLQDKCKLILTSSETLLGHVDDILDFTSIEKGEQELHNDVFDLQVLLNRVVGLNRKKAHQKNVQFKYTYQNGLPQNISGDKRKLMQVLNNLLDNAVKFTSYGEVALHVEFAIKRDGKIAFTFIVTDTGIGISKEKMSTIYESFTKKSFADKREFYGLGLGLYVAKSYVDLQNGSIEIKNTSHQGTECRVALDFMVDHKPLPLSEELPKLSNPKIEDFNLGGCTILLVEDNKMNQMVIKLAAKNWKNINLDIANHGGEALDMLTKTDYDLILMDLQMPVMDGFEATANIRAGKAGESLTDIPILVVTADATDATKKEIFRLGANDYMTKPVKADVLYSKIKNSLGRRREMA